MIQKTCLKWFELVYAQLLEITGLRKDVVKQNFNFLPFTAQLAKNSTTHTFQTNNFTSGYCDYCDICRILKKKHPKICPLTLIGQKLLILSF